MHIRLIVAVLGLAFAGVPSSACAQSWIKQATRTLTRIKPLQTETGRVRIDVLGQTNDSSVTSDVDQESIPQPEFNGVFANALVAPAISRFDTSDGLSAEFDPTHPLDKELATQVGFARVQAIRFDRDSNWSHEFSGEYFVNEESDEHVIAPREQLIEMAFSRDIGNAWYRLRDDSAAVFQPQNLLALAIAGGGALVLRSEVDGQVRKHTAKHRNRWGNGSTFLGNIGDAEVQIPILLGVYYMSLRNQDEELHDFSTTLLSAFTINGLSTLAIKVVTDTDRPSDTYNDGRFGFPSYHSSSSFTVASVIDEYYGMQYGVPAYVVAGLIGWSRIDSRDHDLSDVLFGSAMGYVIGKSIARHHLCGDSRVQILPWFEPSNGTAGISLSREF
jgi:membrane-associated phospholipid phosphatase